MVTHGKAFMRFPVRLQQDPVPRHGKDCMFNHIELMIVMNVPEHLLMLPFEFSAVLGVTLDKV